MTQLSGKDRVTVKLTPLKKTISFEMEDLYTDSLVEGLSPDHAVYQVMKGNTIHRDADNAKQAGFDRPIAVGMLGYGLMVEWVASVYGERWATNGEIEIAFVRPIYFHSEVEIGGEWVGSALSVWIKDSEGNVLVRGTACLHADEE